MTTIAATRTKRTQTDAEIVALSTTIRAGLAAAAEMKAGSVPAAKRKKLCALVEEGKRAKAEFVEANLGLAYKAANSRPSVVRGIENVEDVVQNGVMGLCRAAELFEPERGYKFSTYAYFWILKAMNDGDRHAASSPVFASETGRRDRMIAYATEDILTEELGRPATEAEIAAAMGKNEHEVSTLHKSSMSFMGFNDVLAESTDGTGSGVDVETAIVLREVLDRLDEDERRVVELRFGLDGGGPRAFEEIGELVGKSSWWARARVESALEKLRESMTDVG